MYFIPENSTHVLRWSESMEPRLHEQRLRYNTV